MIIVISSSHNNNNNNNSSSNTTSNTFEIRVNLRTKIQDFGGSDTSIILILRGLKGWNYHVHREFPGGFESANLSRDNLSREIGLTAKARTGNLDLEASAHIFYPFSDPPFGDSEVFPRRDSCTQFGSQEFTAQVIQEPLMWCKIEGLMQDIEQISSQDINQLVDWCRTE